MFKNSRPGIAISAKYEKMDNTGTIIFGNAFNTFFHEINCPVY